MPSDGDAMSEMLIASGGDNSVSFHVGIQQIDVIATRVRWQSGRIKIGMLTRTKDYYTGL